MYIFLSRIALFFRIHRRVYLKKQRWKSILTLFFHSSNLSYSRKFYHFYNGWDTLKWKNVNFGTWKFLCTFSIPKLHLFWRFIEGYILKNRDGNHIWSQLCYLKIWYFWKNIQFHEIKWNVFSNTGTYQEQMWVYRW